MKKCVVCNKEIHPKRLEILPKTNKCVECSNTNKKAGVNVMKGEGDHTYVETIIMEHEDYLKYQELENKNTDFDEIPLELDENTFFQEDKEDFSDLPDYLDLDLNLEDEQ